MTSTYANQKLEFTNVYHVYRGVNMQVSLCATKAKNWDTKVHVITVTGMDNRY